MAVVRTPSASVFGEAARVWMLPAFQVRYASSAASGSTPTTLTVALWFLAEIAVPASSPPPPSGAAITSRPGSSSSSSRATVP